MEIDIRLDYEKSYPNDAVIRFSTLSPIMCTENAVRVILGGRERSVSAACSFDLGVCVARAYNEIGEEGYLVWPEGIGLTIEGESQEQPYLWLEDVEALPEVLWEILQREEGAEREERIDFDDDY